MRRGDFVTIAMQGDLGKPRPALVIQADQFDQHATRAKRYDVFKEYTALVDDQSKHLATLRGLFELQEGVRPLDMLIPDQFIDRTFAREKSFFGSGCVAHVGFSHPTCPRLSGHAAAAARHSLKRSLIMERYSLI